MARLDLAREAKTDVSFDSQLAEVDFPSAADSTADVLIRADQKRAELIRLQARSASLRELRSFARRDRSATAAVEAQVALIRQDLHLPTSSGQLF